MKRGSRQVSYLDDVVPRHEAIVALQVAVYDWYCVGMEVAHAAADVREHGQKRVLPRKTNGLVLEDITERSEFHEFLQYAQTPEGMWTWYVDMEMERRETKKRRRRGEEETKKRRRRDEEGDNSVCVRGQIASVRICGAWWCAPLHSTHYILCYSYSVECTATVHTVYPVYVLLYHVLLDTYPVSQHAPTSCTRLGCRSNIINSISALNLFTASSFTSSASTRFNAHGVPRHVAAYTCPRPPCPIFFPTSTASNGT